MIPKSFIIDYRNTATMQILVNCLTYSEWYNKDEECFTESKTWYRYTLKY